MATLKEQLTEKLAGDVVTREEAQRFADEAAAKAVERVLASLAQHRTDQPQGGDVGDMLRGLAKAIAEVGNQGTGKVVVDPAVLEKRSIARRRMNDLIVEARDLGERPQYVLTATVHLSDQIIVPLWTDAQRMTHQTKIHWTGVPSEAMLPAEGDGFARGIYEAFCESIGKAPGTVARLLPVNHNGSLVTPGGHVFEALPAIPKGYEGGDLEVEAGALPGRDTPHNGLEVLGRHSPGAGGRTVNVRVLGTVSEPAKQMVA